MYPYFLMIKQHQLTVQPMALLMAQTSEGGPIRWLVPVSMIAIHPPLHAMPPITPKAILKYNDGIKIITNMYNLLRFILWLLLSTYPSTEILYQSGLTKGIYETSPS